MRRMRRRLTVALFALATLLAMPAPGWTDLLGTSAADHSLIEANPGLERIGRENPAALAPVLEKLREITASVRRVQAGDDLDPKDRDILDTNPAIEEIYRASPEAALDLLRLIREAVAN
jgi:hypothetical protein